uniref:Uncharacterized protein n=1 Tax=Canis lupus familiaris TaxID=9615 RepID=A0A8P0P116_CANLF
MTPTLMALLCLRLSMSSRTRVQAGTLPKPTIWAEPGSVIPWRTPVTLWCQGSLEAKVYRLHRERQSVTWDRQESLEPKDKAKFSITHMTGVYAGQYYCYYGSTTEKYQDGLYQAEFSLSPVTSACGGTYRYYGSSNTSSLLSHPSDPWELLVSVILTSDLKDYTVENLIRLGMATFVLVLLGILLLEAQHSQRRTPGAARR